MKETIRKLTIWKIDIDSDIRAEWTSPKDKSELIRQSTQLAMAIGLLESLGENSNIEE